MSASSQGAWRGPIPSGLIGMAVMMLVLEQFMSRHHLDFSSCIPFDWRMTGWAARSEVGQSDVLCFGDSQAKVGVLSPVLEHRLGTPVYNLALIGGQSPSSFYLLRRALASGARPRALVLSAFPSLLASDLRINLRQWPELLTTGECLELAWTARDARLLVTTLVALRLPSVNARQQIRERVLAALRGEPNRARQDVQVHIRNWNLNGGSQVAPRNPRFVDEAGPLVTESLHRRWNYKPVNAIYLRQFLALAAARHLPVFLLMPTLSPAWQSYRERIGLDEPYTRFVRSLQARFPNLIVIDGRHSGYSSTVFIDPAHLDRRGAAVLSADLAEIIGNHLTGASPVSGWLELPMYRDRPIDARLEDLEQSRLALAIENGRQRR